MMCIYDIYIEEWPDGSHAQTGPSRLPWPILIAIPCQESHTLQDTVSLRSHPSLGHCNHRRQRTGVLDRWTEMAHLIHIIILITVSYTHLTLPTNREV